MGKIQINESHWAVSPCQLCFELSLCWYYCYITVIVSKSQLFGESH